MLMAPPPPPPPIVFPCEAALVWDGDGITCADGRKVRLSGINAREIDGDHCRKGHPCPAAPAPIARAQLVELLGGKRGVIKRRKGEHIVVRMQLRCELTGASYDRVTAFCTTAKGSDLSCAMLASGTVAKWHRHWADHRCPKEQSENN
jgi:endonuclease YncB( thermonuclease family)